MPGTGRWDVGWMLSGERRVSDGDVCRGVPDGKPGAVRSAPRISACGGEHDDGGDHRRRQQTEMEKGSHTPRLNGASVVLTSDSRQLLCQLAAESSWHSDRTDNGARRSRPQ